MLRFTAAIVLAWSIAPIASATPAHAADGAWVPPNSLYALSREGREEAALRLQSERANERMKAESQRRHEMGGERYVTVPGIVDRGQQYRDAYAKNLRAREKLDRAINAAQQTNSPYVEIGVRGEHGLAPRYTMDDALQKQQALAAEERTLHPGYRYYGYGDQKYLAEATRRERELNPWAQRNSMLGKHWSGLPGAYHSSSTVIGRPGPISKAFGALKDWISAHRPVRARGPAGARR